MKYLLVFIFCFTTINVQSQDDNYYEIIYSSSSMTLNSYKQPIQAYMSLYVQGDKSIYQWNTERKLDSVRTEREITNEDLNRYFSVERYSIEIEKNKIIYYDVISDVEYQYREDISFDWKLESETKIIKGYKCKKATVSYGGRKWQAWYAIDLPINAGPYKFKDLPGLIIKLSDITNSYDFVLYSLKEKETLPLKKSFHHSEENDRVTLDRTEYNKIRFKYNSLGFKARMDILNKKSGDTGHFEFTSSDGSNPFADERNVDRSKNNNFIEIDHD